MNLIERLHEENLRCAEDYLRRESELIDRLQIFDDKKGYRYYDCTSLFQYAVNWLKLSESKSYELIAIARKSRQVPELKKAISQGTINTSQARRIVSVITLEDALKAMTALYLEKKDPVEKAKRILSMKDELSSRRVTTQKTGKRTAIPALVRHEVVNRDKGQCTFRDSQGKRCSNRKWLDLHHRQAVSDGGEHNAANIVTVCRQHHQMHHQFQ